MGTKSMFASKTLWVQVLAVIAIVVGSFSKPVGDFLALHFSAVGAGWAVVNAALRFLSKDKLQLSDS